MSRMIFKRFIFLIALTALVFSSACVLFETDDPDSPPNRETEETQDTMPEITAPTIETLPLPEPRDLENREILSVWSGFEGVEKNVLEQLVREFNTESSHTFIQLASMSWPLLHQKMAAAPAAGNGPDFIIQNYRQIKYYEDWGLLTDISDMYRAEKLFEGEAEPELVFNVRKDHYPENVMRELSFTTANGQESDAAVPMAYIPQRLFYRSDLFETHGYEAPPDTLEALFSVADSLAGELNAIPYGLALSFEQIFGPLGINQLGHPPVNAGSRDVDFLTDGFARYLESIVSLADNGLMPDATEDHAELFRTGQLLMYIGDLYDVSLHQAAGVRFDIAPLPGGSGAQKQVTEAYLFVPTVFINNRIEHFFEWVNFWNMTESQRIWSFRTGHPPVVTDYSGFEEDREWLGSQAPAFTRSLEAFALDSNVLEPDYETLYDQYLRRYWLQALSGSLTVDEALEQAAEAIEAYFEALRVSEEEAAQAEMDQDDSEAETED